MQKHRFISIFYFTAFGAFAGLFIGFVKSPFTNTGSNFVEWLTYPVLWFEWPILGALIAVTGALSFHYWTEGA